MFARGLRKAKLNESKEQKSKKAEGTIFNETSHDGSPNRKRGWAQY